jgi:hypothetical protein
VRWEGRGGIEEDDEEEKQETLNTCKRHVWVHNCVMTIGVEVNNRFIFYKWKSLPFLQHHW